MYRSTKALEAIPEPPEWQEYPDLNLVNNASELQHEKISSTDIDLPTLQTGSIKPSKLDITDARRQSEVDRFVNNLG